jgi:hypothetical protein
MKKMILGIVCALVALPGIAQIQLEENKTLPQGQQKGEVQNIANVGKYYANIVAYAMICKFPEADNKIIFDNYFKKLSQFKLSQFDRDFLLQDYETEFKITMEKNKGKTEKDSSCDKFKPEYDKIVEYVKK